MQRGFCHGLLGRPRPCAPPPDSGRPPCRGRVHRPMRTPPPRPWRPPAAARTTVRAAPRLRPLRCRRRSPTLARAVPVRGRTPPPAPAAAQRHVEQRLLRLGRRHPRDRPHLRVGDDAAPHGVAQLRQVCERAPPARARERHPARVRYASSTSGRRRRNSPSRCARRTAGSEPAIRKRRPECGRTARRCGRPTARSRPGDLRDARPGGGGKRRQPVE